jgi:hypothetical protein
VQVIERVQVRGYAPNGMVESWNIGKMGLGLQLVALAAPGEDFVILSKWVAEYSLIIGC